jgi:Holliday junction resolvasome RuvABC endonuclease subunit
MLKYKIEKLEQALGCKIKKNSIALGLDCATKTGYCIAKSNSTTVDFNIGFINLDMGEIADKHLRNELRYEELYLRFKNLIKSEYTVVIEDVYFSRNPATVILLARIGAIAWTIAKEKECNQIIWKSAVQARKMLGLPCNKKKEVIMQTINNILKLKLTNSDEIDAIILALVGLVEE